MQEKSASQSRTSGRKILGLLEWFSGTSKDGLTSFPSNFHIIGGKGVLLHPHASTPSPSGEAGGSSSSQGSGAASSSLDVWQNSAVDSSSRSCKQSKKMIHIWTLQKKRSHNFLYLTAQCLVGRRRSWHHHKKEKTKYSRNLVSWVFLFTTQKVFKDIGQHLARIHILTLTV